MRIRYALAIAGHFPAIAPWEVHRLTGDEFDAAVRVVEQAQAAADN